VDFYRLESEAELETTGFVDLLDPGQVVAIEWCDRFPHALPGDGLGALRQRQVIEKGAQRPLLYVESSECIGCKACLQLGCPALEWVLLPPQDQAALEKKKGEAFVNPTLCTGCELCSQLCRKGAIRKKDGNN
jgi:ferredoxin